MDSLGIDNQVLITKILNELKYNKRMLYNWNNWFDGTDEIGLQKFLEEKIDEICKGLKGGNLKLEEDEIQAIPLYKKIRDDVKTPQNIVTFSSQKRISGTVEFNYFIETSLQVFLVSVIWLETVGKLLDGSFQDDVYANRLSSSQGSFFQPYFKAYSNFRDSHFKKMRQWVEDRETGLYVQVDLSRYYYSINIKKLKEDIEEQLRAEFDKYSAYKTLTNYIFKVIEKYNELSEIKEFLDSLEKNEKIKSGGVLPIGFLPSNVLSNYYLIELDTLIKDQFYPVNYSRYVDDIVFLIRTDIHDQEQNGLLQINNITKRLAETKKEFKNNINLNEEKTLFFVVNKKNDINYLNKFEKETQQLSSDSYRLIDPNEYDKEFENAYNLTKDITKLSDLFTIVRDKKYISRVISTVFNYIFWNIKEDNHEDNITLSKKFIEYFYSFVDDEFFLNLFDYWYQLIIIEMLSEGILLIEFENNGKKSLSKFKFWERYQSLEEYSGGNKELLKKFLSRYKILLRKLVLAKPQSPLYEIQEYFRYPRYKLVNLVKDESLFNYEKQLRIFLKYTCTHSITQTKDSNESFLRLLRENFNNRNDKKILSFGGQGDIQEYGNKDAVIIAQSNFYSYDDRKNHFLEFSKSKSNVADIIKTLNDSDRSKADILLYPEQGIPLQELYSIVRFARKTKTMIIGGLDFIYLESENLVLNLTFIIRPFKVSKHGKEYKDAEIVFLPKIYPSPTEYEIFHNSKPKAGSHWNIHIPNAEDFEAWGEHIVHFKGSVHAVLNCYEATSIDLKYEISKAEPHVIHLITNNQDIKYYYQIAESLSRDLMAVSTITNYSKLGGVEVYSPYREEYKRQISVHKGARNTHVDICNLDLKSIKDKRLNNLDKSMKQNPPKYYYRNIGKHE